MSRIARTALTSAVGGGVTGGVLGGIGGAIASDPDSGSLARDVGRGAVHGTAMGAGVVHFREVWVLW